MKRMMMLFSLFALLLLAACGNNGNTEEGVDQPQEDVEETEGTTGEEDAEEPGTDEKEDADRQDPVNEEQTKEISYNVGSETKTETAALKTSDNQGYSIYVLPGYELTGEEPGKDLLYQKENDSTSMRIEILKDPDWAMLEENIPLELEFVSKDIQNPTDEKLQIPGADIYAVENEAERITMYLIKDEKFPMKLTIFSTVDQDQREAVIEMAKTIRKNG